MMVDEGMKITLTVSMGNEGVEVPDVTGKTYEDAENALQKAGFVVNKTESSSSAIAENHVISQNPDAGSKAPNGSAVTITVSTGAEDSKVRVPDLLGMSEVDAMATLVELGLELGSVSQVNSEEYEADQVCYQDYSVGSFVEPGTKISLKISMGAKVFTYSYSGSITGPTLEEDSAYEDGTSVSVTITTEDGTQLLNTKTSSFPIAVNYTGIKSATGTIQFVYTNTTSDVTTTDPATGETVVTPGTSTEKTVTRTVQFTKEEN